MIIRAKNEKLESIVFNYGPGVWPNDGSFLIDNKYLIFNKLLAESIVIELNELGEPIDAFTRNSTEYLTYNGKTAFEYLIKVPHLTSDEREYIQECITMYDINRLPWNLSIGPKTNLIEDVRKNFTVKELENVQTVCRRNDIFIISNGNRPSVVLKFDKNEKIIDGYIASHHEYVYNGKYVADWIFDLDHITEEERKRIIHIMKPYKERKQNVTI